VVQVVLLLVLDGVVDDVDLPGMVANLARGGVPNVVLAVLGAVAVHPLQLELGVGGGGLYPLVHVLGGD